MGCFLGDSVFRISDCEAYIVSNGHRDVERIEFPADQGVYRAYMLLTTSCGYRIGGGTAYLEYYNQNDNVWIQIDSISVSIGNGYVYIYFDVIPNNWVGKMRIRYSGGCTKEWIQYKNTHKGCNSDGLCVDIDGRGDNKCLNNIQCRHRKCIEGGICSYVPGIGDDECTADVGQCFHTECRNKVCTVVDGPGKMQCNQMDTESCINQPPVIPGTNRNKTLLVLTGLTGLGLVTFVITRKNPKKKR